MKTQNKKEDKITISISMNNWRFLQDIRVKNRFGSIDEVLDLIVIHSKDAIKRKDLEFTKSK